MATENLEINIGANTQDLQTGLNQASQSVTNFGRAVQTSLKPTADATQSLVNLSRIAQDAPYGFIGIANNLNPMLESFQRLQKESGSAGAALKAMVSGLAGPAGIGVALGVVSSLVVAFGDEISDWMNKTTDLEKANKSLRDSFFDSLKTVEATISNDQALISVITDVTQSTEAREAALKQLKSEYKGNIELQKTDINDGDKLKQIIDQISGALIRKAEIEAISKVIGEEYAKQLRLQTADAEEARDALGALQTATSWVKGWFQGGWAYSADLEITNKALEKTRKESEKTGEVIEKLKKTRDELVGQSFKLGDYNTIKTDQPKAPKAKTETTTNAIKETVDTSALETLKLKQKLYQDDVYAFKDYGDLIVKEELRIALEKARINKASANEIANIKEQSNIKLEQNQINFGKSLDKLFDAADRQWEKDQKEKNKKLEEEENEKTKKLIAIEKERQKQLEEIQLQHEKFADVVSKNVTNALFTMYDAIQQGEPPLKALGDYVAHIAEQFAAAVIQATIFKGILKLLDTGTGGGAGFFGSILGGVSKLLGFADGGIVSRPTIAMVGEGGQSEAIMPLNKLGNMMNSTFNAGVVSGVSGGGGQFVLKGNDLVLALQRSNYSLNLRRGA